jgi:poly-gamma-glutamate capsule biosynthesis protein CapA/YwtB (metallophosphatase superfamily)
MRAVVALGVTTSLLIAAARAAEEPTAVRELTVAVVGDIMLGGTAAPELARYGYDYPFERIGKLLRDADLAFGNLEGPLTIRGEAQRKQYVFRSPPDLVAPALARAGFDIVSLANNHSMDYSVEGLRDTMQALQSAGIRHVGAGENLAAARQPALLERGGGRVAVLAYSLTFPEDFWAEDHRPGTAFGHEDQVRADVASARSKADIVLVSFHWGQEGSTELRDYQRKLGHAAIEAGAAAVIGHHPHVLQGVERYRGGVILYSLGNFVFGSYSRDATRSVVAVLSFRDGRVREVAFHPINVKNADVVFQPYPLSRSAADEVVEQLRRMSEPLGTAIENRNGVAVLTMLQDTK